MLYSIGSENWSTPIDHRAWSTLQLAKSSPSNWVRDLDVSILAIIHLTTSKTGLLALAKIRKEAFFTVFPF